MFGPAFYGNRYYGGRYFGPGGMLAPELPEVILPNPLNTYRPRRRGHWRPDPITPDTLVSFSIDFSLLMPEDETISGIEVTCSVHPRSLLSDATPAARLSDDAYVQVDGVTTTQWFHNGVDDVDYVLDFLATCTNGEKIPFEVWVAVRSEDF